MPTLTETLRQKVEEHGAYATAKATGLQYRVLNEFAKGERTPNGAALDALADHFGLELKPKTATKGRASAGPKQRR
jgi:hypothetical protein